MGQVPGSDPLDIQSSKAEECRHGPSRLVRWSDGGFVKWQCSTCDESRVLTDAEFRDLPHNESCTRCGHEMNKATLPYSNYGYRCERCERTVLLADLLPWARPVGQ